RDNAVPPPRRIFHRAFQRPVEGLGGTSGEGQGAALETDRLLYLLARDLDRGLRLIAPARWRMRVGELLFDPRVHSPGDFRRGWSRRLVVEVDHAAFALAAIRRHSPRNRSISA